MLKDFIVRPSLNILYDSYENSGLTSTPYSFFSAGTFSTLTYKKPLHLKFILVLASHSWHLLVADHMPYNLC